jgi:DUF1365 family protein
MNQDKLNSCLYKARVMHNRLHPKVHHFHYDIFMFYLDLAELDTISQKFRWLSRNRFNLFNFRDSDHLQLPFENPDQSKNIREHITQYLTDNAVQIGNGRIMLLTNLCTLGYQFNPVSFYICFNEQEEPVCTIAEVCNTFHEMKPYFIGKKSVNNEFNLYTVKNFYVSPFIDLDYYFDFKVKVPEEKLNIVINDHDATGNLYFKSSLQGEKASLTDANMIRYFLSIPFITMQITWLIHWQAFKLWCKQIGFHRKAENPQLQTEVYRRYKS